MNPKILYSLIFWGLILPIVAIPIAGLNLRPAVGFAMVAFGSWALGKYSKPFRMSSVAAALLFILILQTPYLSEFVASFTVLFLQCFLGWSLLSCVARDCQAHGQIDLAATARWQRIAYVLLMVSAPLMAHLLPSDGSFPPFVTFVPTVLLLLAYVLLVWTFQSAKFRLFQYGGFNESLMFVAWLRCSSTSRPRSLTLWAL